MDVEARTGYEASKLARERYAEYFHNFHDLALAGLRFFSVYQGFDGAEEHKGEFANTVARFTDRIANGEQPKLFGDGTQTRDFTHVDDIVRSCELAAEHALQGIDNVGTEKSYTFNDEIAVDLKNRLADSADFELVHCGQKELHQCCGTLRELRESLGR